MTAAATSFSSERRRLFDASSDVDTRKRKKLQAALAMGSAKAIACDDDDGSFGLDVTTTGPLAHASLAVELQTCSIRLYEFKKCKT